MYNSSQQVIGGSAVGDVDLMVVQILAKYRWMTGGCRVDSLRGLILNRTDSGRRRARIAETVGGKPRIKYAIGGDVLAESLLGKVVGKEADERNTRIGIFEERHKRYVVLIGDWSDGGIIGLLRRIDGMDIGKMFGFVGDIQVGLCCRRIVVDYQAVVGIEFALRKDDRRTIVVGYGCARGSETGVGITGTGSVDEREDGSRIAIDAQ